MTKLFCMMDTDDSTFDVLGKDEAGERMAKDLQDSWVEEDPDYVPSPFPIIKVGGHFDFTRNDFEWFFIEC